MSVRRGIVSRLPVHQVDELLEQVARRRAGPGPASGWYCTLKARRVERAEPFDDAVVQVHVGDLDAAGERVGVDRVVVVLAGDLDLRRSRRWRTGWLPPWWPNGSLNVSAAERRRQELVAEADAEHRHLAEQAARWRRRRSGTGAGSPGPLDRNTPSGSRASTSAAGVDAGTTSTVASRATRWRRIVRLDAEVVGDDERRVGRRRAVYGVGRWSPAATRSTPSVPRLGARGRLQRRLVGGAERAGHRAGVADVAGEPAGVDAGDAGHAVAARGRRRGRRRCASCCGAGPGRARSTPRQNGRRLSSSSAFTP